MTSGSLRFNGHNLNDYGHPEYKLSRTPDPAPPSLAARWNHTITITQQLHSDNAATNQAKLEKLHQIFATGEGLFEIHNENNAITQLFVKVGQSSIPEAIKNRTGRWEITLEGYTAVDQPLAASATYEPFGGLPTILLHNLSDFSETTNTTRTDERLSNRSLTTTTYNFSARYYAATPLVNATQRLQNLLAEKANLENLATKEGTLTWSTYSRTIQISSIRARVDDSYDFLTLEVQARSVAFPGDSEIELSLNISTGEENCGAGEGRFSINGTVKADNRDLANAKINSLIDEHRSNSRRLKTKQINDRYLEGEDSELSQTWTGLDFSLDFVDLAEMEFTTEVDQTEDPSGCRSVISGEIKSNNEALAILKARELGASLDGLLTREQLTLRYEPHCGDLDFKDIGLTDTTLEEAKGTYHYLTDLELWRRSAIDDGQVIDYQFVRVGDDWVLQKLVPSLPDEVLDSTTSFETTPATATGWANITSLAEISGSRAIFTGLSYSYEYLCGTADLKGSFQQEFDTTAFAVNTTSLSGSISAPTPAEAETFVRSLIPPGVLVVQDRVTNNGTIQGENTLLTSINFTFAWQRTKTQVELEWQEQFTSNYETMTGTRTISGTAWAVDDSTAKTQIATLAATIAGNPKEKTLTSGFRNIDSVVEANLSQVTFTYTWEEALTGEPGHDIIRATWTAQRVGQVDGAAFAETICGDPVKQTSLGYNTGTMTASGSVTARVQATARTWGQSKRLLIASQGGETGAELPPQESNTVSYPPLEGSTAVTHTFSFTYAFQYATGLKNLWPATFAMT